MDQEIVELLDRIHAGNAELGREFVRAEPVNQAEIDDAEQVLGVSIPDDVLTLFRWSNGSIRPNGQHGASTFFNGLTLDIQPLAIAVEDVAAIAGSRFEIKGADDFGRFYPYPSIMIADAYEALQVVVSLVEGSFGSVWAWRMYGERPTPCFDSFRDFLELQVAYLDAGVIKQATWAPEGRTVLIVDDKHPNFSTLDIPDGWRKSLAP